jgi:outer membrane protein assembly factor BamB
MRISLRTGRIGLLACILVCLLSGPLTQSASGEPAWSTYHRDAARSGVDPDATEPIAPTLAWQSPFLGAAIYSQPVILGSRVYVATIADDIFALDAASGAILWRRNVGTPVPATALPCGNIYPTVGIVGTPVIDTATNAIYAVADTWDGSNAHHVLKGLNLATGEELLSTPVDPPGADPKTLLQRTALNLDEGHVVFGFGGNFGSCSQELAPLVAAPAGGGPARFWQDHDTTATATAGGVWATSGVAVDAAGRIYATTANPLPEGKPITVAAYDYSNSVLELSLDDFVGAAKESPAPSGWFKPPNWETLGNNDLDLGSAGPELLPGGLLFQAGKDGRGYLIDQSALAATPGASAVFEGPVCGGHGSFGGDAFANGVIYLPCTNGVQALAYDQGARTFTPLWQGPSDAFGSPIVSAGLVWDVQTGGFNGDGTKLYGLDPATGVPRYTLELPSPVADHFASPSAAGGKLFLATGSTATAYQIAKPTPAAAGTPIAITAPRASASRVPSLLHTRLRADRRGRVRIALRCAAVSGHCKGTITLRAKFVSVRRVGAKRVRRTVFTTLGHARFNHAKGSFTATVYLGRKARRLLGRHHGRLALQVIVAAPPAKARKLAASLTAAR